MTQTSEWAPGWYGVTGDTTMQREWNGAYWTGNTRPTKRFLGILSGEDPKITHAAGVQFHGMIARLQEAQRAGLRGHARALWVAAYPVSRAAFGPDSLKQWNRALVAIDFDAAAVESASLGSLTAVDGQIFEVFHDFVTFGAQGLDNSKFSVMTVFQDGHIQITSNVVPNKTFPTHQTHDLRTAAIQVSGPAGVLRAEIHPNLVPQAQQIAAHFNAVVQSSSAAPVSRDDLNELVQKVLNATGQNVAEKLSELDKLRYSRLLSDEDWNLAKARILEGL